jgi:hypothetical protein
LESGRKITQADRQEKATLVDEPMGLEAFKDVFDTEPIDRTADVGDLQKAPRP